MLKSAITKAKKELAEVFGISGDVYLEEVVTQKNGWKITLSYFERPHAEIELMAILNPKPVIKRYKIVQIDRNGELVSIEKHEIDR